MPHAHLPADDASTWNYMQTELVPQDLLIQSMIGPGHLTRDQAHAEVRSLLQRSAAVHPPFRQLVAAWQRGAKDDTVFGGPFVWAIYDHAGSDPSAGALEWLEDYATTLRRSGLDVRVAAPSKTRRQR
jgi:hypothetical protein